MLKKVQQAAKKQADRLARQATLKRSALADAKANATCMKGNSKLGKEEALRIELGNTAYSKPSEHDTGFNYGIDARKARKQMKPPAAHYDKPSDFGTKTATFGSKTDAGINSYFRNKRGDNLPRNSK